MKNHQSRPTGSIAFSEVNATNYSRNKNYNSHGRGRGRGRGHGRGQFFGRSRGNKYNNIPQPLQTQPQKKLKSVIVDVQERPQYKSETVCFRCGSKGHWSRVCRTPSHLCQLYKASLKGKEKETNFNEHHTPIDDTTHLDVSDFTDDFTDNRN